jgi:Holliday junction resolvase RusA-like endonuclease
MTLVVFGPPRTKKTSNRIVRVGRFNKIIPSAAQVAWADSAAIQLRVQWGRRPPLTGPLHVRAVFYRDKNLGDLCGYMQALGDVLEMPSAKASKRAPAKAGVIENDRQIVSWDGTRLDKDAKNPRVELEITVVEALAVLGHGRTT